MIFDYSIIGMGAAGSHLALAMNNDSFFSNKKILLFNDDNNQNHKTWCFWEKKNGKWNDLISKSWKSTYLIFNDKEYKFSSNPYEYKMIDSKDFDIYTKNVISNNLNFYWKNDKVIEIIANKNHYSINTVTEKYKSRFVFDSRLEISINDIKNNSSGVLQHFLGWYIKTKVDVFDNSAFTMMDFWDNRNDTTKFMYILPVKKNEALVECTYFSSKIFAKNHYEESIKEYLINKFKIKTYEIIRTEYGEIPMYNYKFHKQNTKRFIKIGTAGGWVKPSTGYSFKTSEKNSIQIINNIKKNKITYKNTINIYYRIIDSIFLTVLEKSNSKGPAIFKDLFNKNDFMKVIEFLNEKSSIKESLKIISSLPKLIFLKATIQLAFKLFLKKLNDFLRK